MEFSLFLTNFAHEASAFCCFSLFLYKTCSQHISRSIKERAQSRPTRPSCVLFHKRSVSKPVPAAFAAAVPALSLLRLCIAVCRFHVIQMRFQLFKALRTDDMLHPAGILCRQEGVHPSLVKKEVSTRCRSYTCEARCSPLKGNQAVLIHQDVSAGFEQAHGPADAGL